MRFTNLDSFQSAFFVRQLEYIYGELLQKEYPEFKFLKYIPMSREAPAGARSITQRMFNKLGFAKIIANNAQDLPRVDVQGEEMTVPTRILGDSYAYSLDDIDAAMMANVPLEMFRAEAAQRAIDQLLNQIAMFGDATHGLYGIFNHPNITAADAPHGDWSMATDPNDILEDLKTLIEGPRILTNGVEFVDTVLMPIDALSIIKHLRVSTLNNQTILQFAQSIYPGVVFDDVADLASIPFTPSTLAKTPTSVAVAFRRDPRKVRLEVPRDFTTLPPQERGLEYTVNCFMKTGGVMSNFPLSINVLQDILPTP